MSAGVAGPEQGPPDAAFYQALGDGRYRATRATVGPWGPDLQHAGPPAALLGRAIEHCAAASDEAGGAPGNRLIGRLAFDILGPLPVDEVAVTARRTRPGRSVELFEAELAAGGRPVMRAAAWRVRTAATQAVREAAVGQEPDRAPGPRLPGPESLVPADAPGWGDGYLRAIEWRFVSGHFSTPGPATVWSRMRIPLVAGEQPSPLQRVLAVADSGNGISNVLDLHRWLFINPELTVHVTRPAAGEWIALQAETVVEADGVGLASSVLSDQRGRLGSGAQILFVAPRS